MNKKGQLRSVDNMYTYFIVIAIILSIGLAVAVVGSILHMVGDGIIPGLNYSLSNSFGEEAEVVTDVAYQMNEAIPWITGLFYALALFGILILAYAYRTTGENYMMILYFVLAIVMILLSILASNIYQTYYEQGGQLGSELQDQGLISFLILYSPVVMTVLLFVGASIMFSGIGREELT